MSVKSKLQSLLQNNLTASVPLAYYPGRKLIGATMEGILSDSQTGAKCLKAIQDTLHPAMLVRMTELWVEAEAFGAPIEISETSFPVIADKVIPDFEDLEEEDIERIPTPSMDAGRLPVFIEAIRNTREHLPDVLLFAGVTGPFSLCSCLADAQEVMMGCYSDPDVLHALLEKVTDFITSYCKEYKAAGASGVFIAEPSICMLSPDMAEEFSHEYMKKIIAEVQDDDFAVVYHNCGDVTPQLENIKALGAMAYHFGDAVSMESVLKSFPDDIPVLGNIHPAKFMPNNTNAFASALKAAQEQYRAFPNFILSSGCDISPEASMETLKTFSL